MRRMGLERVEAEAERIREEEEGKRRVLAKKHAVSKCICAKATFVVL